MLKFVRNWLKAGALSVAVMGLAGVAQADSMNPSDVAQTTEGVVNHSARTQIPSYHQALKGQTLRVGVFISPPFAFITDSMSKLHGIDVDIITELQKRTGFNLDGNRLLVMNFDEMLEVGKKGGLDIMGGGITLSRSRSQFFDFSAPSMNTSLVLVSRANNNIEDIQDLDGRNLAAQSGSTGASLFEESDISVNVTNSTSAFMSLYEVYREKADAVILDRTLAEFYQSNWPNAGLEIVQELSDDSNLGLLFKKNAQVNNCLQAAYQDMINDGTVDRIVATYMESSLASK